MRIFVKDISAKLSGTDFIDFPIALKSIPTNAVSKYGVTLLK